MLSYKSNLVYKPEQQLQNHTKKSCRQKLQKKRFWNVSPQQSKIDVKKTAPPTRELTTLVQSLQCSKNTKLNEGFEKKKSVEENFLNRILKQDEAVLPTTSCKVDDLFLTPSKSDNKKEDLLAENLKNSFQSDNTSPASLPLSSQFVDSLKEQCWNDDCSRKSSLQNVLENEDLIILPDEDKKETFSNIDINRCVRNIVSNLRFNETETLSNMTSVKIAQRMSSLYHQDFSNRLNEIERCLEKARRRYSRISNDLKEVRPGLRQIDLNTLRPGEWLNDVIINKYISLLVNAKPWACCVSSFFYEGLQRHGNQTMPDDWFERKYMLIPLCIDSHWSLLCVSPLDRSIKVFNSLSISHLEIACIEIIKDYVELNFDEELNTKSKWKIVYPSQLPSQKNVYDCGVYVCMFARKITVDGSLNIRPLNVATFRECIRKELIANKIMR